MAPILRSSRAVGTGFYTQWSIVSGSPLHWAAVLQLDASYIEDSTLNHKDSFKFNQFGGLIQPTETIISMTARAWLQCVSGGGLNTLNRLVMPFMRFTGADQDGTQLSLPVTGDIDVDPQPIVEMTSTFPFTVKAGEIKGPANTLLPEWGLRNDASRRVRCYAYQIDFLCRPYTDSMGLVGRKWWR